MKPDFVVTAAVLLVALVVGLWTVSTFAADPGLSTERVPARSVSVEPLGTGAVPAAAAVDPFAALDAAR